jgi:PHP family Zn ribbon phosphoesterase
MTKFYDLHIHSCLSPCASGDMTPANIAGMAHLKGLSLIALTDHNTGGNLPAMAKAAARYGLLFVPGIEVTTSEEVHVLTYFPDVSTAVCFGDKLYDSLPDIQNRPDIFGKQLIMDENDNITGTLPKLLLQAVPYSVDDIVRMAKETGGCAVPAHINRDSFSLLANIGFIPSGLFRCIEATKSLPCLELSGNYHVFYSSDAHDLGNISEPLETLSGIETTREFIDFVNNF